MCSLTELFLELAMQLLNPKLMLLTSNGCNHSANSKCLLVARLEVCKNFAILAKSTILREPLLVHQLQDGVNLLHIHIIGIDYVICPQVFKQKKKCKLCMK